MPRCGGTQPQPKKDTQLTKNKLQSHEARETRVVRQEHARWDGRRLQKEKIGPDSSRKTPLRGPL